MAVQNEERGREEERREGVIMMFAFWGEGRCERFETQQEGSGRSTELSRESYLALPPRAYRDQMRNDGDTGQQS